MNEYLEVRTETDSDPNMTSVASLPCVDAYPPATHNKDAQHTAYMSKLTKWWSDDEEAVLRRKLDVRLVTTSFFLFLCAILDRSNLGNAKVAGMERSLHMSDKQFQWLLTIFYIAYIIFQFSILAYKIVPPRVWLALCAVAWGITGICQAATTSWEGMMIARFCLGVSESGFGTGWALYLSFFYPKSEIGLRFAIYVSAGTLAAAVAGSMAYGIVHAHTSIESWRLLFLLEGIPTLIMAPIAYFVLPNSIQTASFLTDREKAIAEARLFRPPPIEAWNAVKPHTSLCSRAKEELRWPKIAALFMDPTTLISSILLFISQTGSATFPVYVPTLLSEMGYGGIRAQGLSAPPYLLACAITLLGCWLTDRYQVRGPVFAFFICTGAIGYLMLACLRATTARYLAIWIIINGMFPALPVLYMWLMANQDSERKTGLGLVIFATVGQCGPLLPARLFPASDKPYYVKGTAISAALLFVGVLMSAGLSYRFWRINRRRDRQDAALDERGSVDGGEVAGEESRARKDDEENSKAVDNTTLSEADRRKIDVLLRGDESPYFRYTI
ncbi:related to nicotinamide mononucleotide permease [Ustilago trichophora]|uniref:Related to nicotinamide mononucleotide permease n=1 Tax=Ustilago trichophora TaxID=86804 RepID=A0A5C3ECC1_9BASI|nr:related to nicotinamide mononucleotide permease [Ustilago trichophora]